MLHPVRNTHKDSMTNKSKLRFTNLDAAEQSFAALVPNNTIQQGSSKKNRLPILPCSQPTRQ